MLYLFIVISEKTYIFSPIYFTQRKEIGPENCEFAFPAEVLNFIRHLVPGNIKGEIREVGNQTICSMSCVTAKFHDVGLEYNLS